MLFGRRNPSKLIPDNLRRLGPNAWKCLKPISHSPKLIKDRAEFLATALAMLGPMRWTETQCAGQSILSHPREIPTAVT
jgi:hypothetical protein